MRPELGKKCVCAACGERFYDLGRSPAKCPKCGSDQPAVKPRVAAAARDVGRTWRRRPEPTPERAEGHADAEEASEADATVEAGDADGAEQPGDRDEDETEEIEIDADPPREND